MKLIFTLSFILISFLTSAQELVLIQFNDKPSSATYLANPTSMLSQKALDRRAKYNIELNLQDVPVETSYVTQIENLGIEPIAISKWFNGIFAELNPNQITQVQNLSFVQEVESFVKNDGLNRNQHQEFQDKFQNENNLLDFNYGNTAE